ncbi:MAG: sulfur carrier protein [Rhodothermales bacterium]|jgi:sulfur carrier protein
MSITVNGEAREHTASTIADLLAELNYGTGSVAIAHNEAFVPRGSYAEIALNPGDRIEIVAPMQGG